MTFGAVFIAFLIAILIPLAPKQRLARNRVSSFEAVNGLDLDRQLNDPNSQHSEKQLTVKDRINSLRSTFENRTVLIWSLWWSLASCGTYQVANYAQTLWGPMQHDGQFVGNGFVECTNTLLCKFKKRDCFG
jgi:hypothetical protein